MTFKNGKFSSKICLEYGFAPTPYWVRHDADGLHFLANLRSSENGTIRFEGGFRWQRHAGDFAVDERAMVLDIEQKLLSVGRFVEQTE